MVLTLAITDLDADADLRKGKRRGSETLRAALFGGCRFIITRARLSTVPRGGALLAKPAEMLAATKPGAPRRLGAAFAARRRCPTRARRSRLKLRRSAGWSVPCRSGSAPRQGRRRGSVDDVCPRHHSALRRYAAARHRVDAGRSVPSCRVAAAVEG